MKQYKQGKCTAQESSILVEQYRIEYGNILLALYDARKGIIKWHTLLPPITPEDLLDLYNLIKQIQ